LRKREQVLLNAIVGKTQAMKPPPFAYHDPLEIDAALELLRDYQGEAKILAGGQSLIALLNFRLSRPTALIDINRMPQLSYITERDGWLCLGAATRQRTIEFSPLVHKKLPLLAEATQLIGHLPTRTRGTIGGSLAHSDPAAEYPAVFSALDGELVARATGSERVLKARDFFQGLMTTALAADEMLIEVRLPLMPAKSGWAFEEFSRRHGDFALVGIAAQISVDGEHCTKARLAAAGVAATPLRLDRAEQVLEQGGLDQRSIAEAATRAAEQVEPTSDLHASAQYRRHLTRVLTHRAITRALARARGERP
jgi:carbon-monoxide dehydrogenase medium subunit